MNQLYTLAIIFNIPIFKQNYFNKKGDDIGKKPLKL